MKEKIYLIPGLMTDHRLWSRIIPLLENDYELVHTPIPHSEDFDGKLQVGTVIVPRKRKYYIGSCVWDYLPFRVVISWKIILKI